MRRFTAFATIPLPKPARCRHNVKEASLNKSTAITGFLGSTLVALAIPLAHGQSPNDALKAVPVDELKGAFLACDRAANGARLDTATIMHCSVVYEELKHRAFGGDFERLLAWARSEASVRKSGERPARTGLADSTSSR